MALPGPGRILQRRGTRRAQIAKLPVPRQHLREIPRGHFGAILADPPWPFATWSHKGLGRSAEAHYGTMSHADINALPIKEIAAKDCVLFLCDRSDSNSTGSQSHKCLGLYL